MSDFNADDFARRIDNAKTVSAITAIFNDVAQLPAAEQKLAVDAIEAITVSDWQKSAPRGGELAQLRMVLDMVDDMQGTPEGDAMREQMEAAMPAAEIAKGSSLILTSIFNYKGEASHALVKTYLAEEAKVPAAEANTAFGMAKLMVTVQEKLVESELQAKPAVRPNPFRKPTAPGNFDL